MNSAQPDQATVAKPAWAAHRERSNRLTLQFMAWVAVSLGRPTARLLLYPITLYFLCFAAAPRRNSARYLARALGRPATWLERFRHLHSFAATVLDRVYFVRGQMQVFDLKVVGLELVDQAMAGGRGAFMLGAHMGSFEALHAIGSGRPGSRVAMAMYPDNARMIHSVLQALAPDFHLGIIEVGRSGSTLAIRDWLDGGGLVGLLGDRHLATENARGAGITELPFLGDTVRFSDGPLRLAQLLRRQVLFMVGLYLGGRRYDVRFEPLADFRTPAATPAEREAQLQAVLRDYVARLETLVHEAPYNWFNFFDYWGDDARH